MAITKTAEKQLTDAMISAILADTGTDGLRNTSSAAYVAHVTRGADPKRTQNWPRIEVSIAARPDRPMAGGWNEGIRIQFDIFTDRDKGPAKREAVMFRLMTLIDRKVFTAGAGGWNFSVPEREDWGEGRASGKEEHWFEVYRVLAMSRTD